MNNETSYFLFQIISFKKFFYVSLGNNFLLFFCGGPPSCGGPGQLPSLPSLKSGPVLSTVSLNPIHEYKFGQHSLNSLIYRGIKFLLVSVLLHKSAYMSQLQSLADTIRLTVHLVTAYTAAWVCMMHTQPFNGLWYGTTRVGRYQKKHTHPDHRTSFIIFLHLQRSVASCLFILRASQSSRTTSVQVLFGLGPSTSYSMHFFTQSSSSFRSTCPYQRSLFWCNINAMSCTPSLCICEK